jgi:hypothetical protein
MTKKRVKFGLAILGALSVFLLALLALVFAPTGASAGKGPVFGQEQDGGGHSGHVNPVYFEPPAGNGPNSGSHNSNGGGVGPCTGTPNPCDAHDDHGAPGQDSWLYGGGGEAANQGDGHSPNHDLGDQPQGGHGNQPPLFLAGYPGGAGGGNGAPQGQSSSCSSKKDKDQDSKNKESDNKSCNSDDNNNTNNGGGDGYVQSLVQNGSSGDPNDDSSDKGDTHTDLVDNDPPPGDDVNGDLPPVDPNCFPFAEDCDTPGGNPPATVLTDPPNKVPEPLTLSLFAVGLTGAAALRRRARQKTRRD